MKSIRSSADTPWRSNGSGFVGNGCVGLVRSFGTVDCGTGRSSIGQMGWPVSRFSTNRNACLVGCASALIRRPFWTTSNSTGAHGVWDYDPPCAPILFDVVQNGRRIKALAQPTKMAFLFVLNRETGQPIWPVEECSVPQSTVPKERTSPTQPFPDEARALRSPGRVGPDDLIDFTPALRAEALDPVSATRSGRCITPPVPEQRGRPARDDSGSGRHRRRELARRLRSIPKRTGSSSTRTRSPTRRSAGPADSASSDFGYVAGQARGGGRGERAALRQHRSYADRRRGCARSAATGRARAGPNRRCARRGGRGVPSVQGLPLISSLTIASPPTT